MKLLPNQLKKRAEAAGVSLEQLAEAVARTGLNEREALKAVRNWLAGRDHPRCKAADIRALAEAVGAQPHEIAKFTSMIRHHRGSPKKAKLLADLIRGKSYVDAENMLAFTTKRAAVNMRKCLQAAMAEAEEAGADVGSLVVAESTVDGSTHIKRFQPKDRGRAHPILKRTSHITISLVERA